MTIIIEKTWSAGSVSTCLIRNSQVYLFCAIFPYVIFIKIYTEVGDYMDNVAARQASCSLSEDFLRLQALKCG